MKHHHPKLQGARYVDSGSAFRMYVPILMRHCGHGLQPHETRPRLPRRKRGDMRPIKIWLKEYIHKWGATYSPKELQMNALGDVYNPEYLVRYLEEKYQT